MGILTINVNNLGFDDVDILGFNNSRLEMNKNINTPGVLQLQKHLCRRVGTHNKKRWLRTFPIIEKPALKIVRGRVVISHACYPGRGVFGENLIIFGFNVIIFEIPHKNKTFFRTKYAPAGRPKGRSRP